MLGAVLHVQHHGRDVQQTGTSVSARGRRFPAYDVARLHEQLRQSSYLHDIQSRVQESIQETHVYRTIILGNKRPVVISFTLR